MVPVSMTTHTFPFDQIERAFHMMETKEDDIIKPLIVFDQPGRSGVFRSCDISPFSWPWIGSTPLCPAAPDSPFSNGSWRPKPPPCTLFPCL